MKSRVTRVIYALALSLLWASPSFGQFEELNKLIPSEANAVAWINVEKVYGSPHAQKQQWLNNARIQYAKSPLFFPAAADRIVLAAQFDISSSQTLWEASMVHMVPTIDFEKIRNLSGGKADVIAGMSAVDNPDGSIIVMPNEHLLASVYPGNRQYVHRWVNSVKDGTSGQLTPYLAEAAEYTKNEGAGTDIIMAIDLSGVVQEGRLRERLANSIAMKNSQTSVDICVECITGLRGVTLGVRIADNPFASIKVDFDHSASIMASLGKPLLLEALDSMGAHVPDFSAFSPRVDGNSFFLEGNISDAGLRQVMSIIEPPPMQVAEKADDHYQGSAYEGMSSEVAATKEHFDAVQVITRELRTTSSPTKGASAAFFERYARKIDNLPIVGVDTDMLDYSAAIADLCREVAGVQRGTGVAVAANNTMVAAQGGGTGAVAWGAGYANGRYGGYGYYTPRSYAASRRAASAGVRAQGAMDKSKLMQTIDAETRDIRRLMSEKYEVDF